MRVLLIEDNPCCQILLSESLECLGHRPCLVKSTKEAIRELQGAPFDVVLLSVKTPASGIVAARAIGAQFCESVRPLILAVSEHDQDYLADRCRQTDFDGYLRKPVTLAELEAALEYRLPSHRNNVLDEDGRAPLPDCLDPRQIGELLSLAEPGDELLEEIVELFAQHGRDLIEHIGHMHRAGEIRGLLTATHQLKGCALAVGARQLVETCLAIEQIGQASGSDVARLRHQFFRAHRAALNVLCREAA